MAVFTGYLTKLVHRSESWTKVIRTERQFYTHSLQAVGSNPKHRVWIRVRIRVHYEHVVQVVSTLNKRSSYYYFFCNCSTQFYDIFLNIYCC